MKVRIFNVCLLVSAIAAGASAQVAKPVVEDVKSSERMTRNAPFSAEALTESVQILWDGTKIVRKTGSKFYRDNDGRFRREDSKTLLGVPGDRVEIAESIKITDPVLGLKYILDVKNRTFKQSTTKKLFESKKDTMFTKQSEWSIKKEISSEKNSEGSETRSEDQAMKGEKQAENSEKQAENREKQAENREKQAENRKKQAHPKDKVPEARPEDPRTRAKQSPDGQTIGNDGIKTKTESLGVQTVHGVVAEGTRTTTTIEVGTIGNDREINVVYEKWYSKELQLTVLSKHSDPRFGEQTYQLSNISRENPPTSLFQPPPDYKNDDDKDGRTKLPRVPAAPSPPKVTIKPPVPPAGRAEPRKPVV